MPAVIPPNVHTCLHSHGRTHTGRPPASDIAWTRAAGGEAQPSGLQPLAARAASVCELRSFAMQINLSWSQRERAEGAMLRRWSIPITTVVLAVGSLLGLAAGSASAGAHHPLAVRHSSTTMVRPGGAARGFTPGGSCYGQPVLQARRAPPDGAAVTSRPRARTGQATQ